MSISNKKINISTTGDVYSINYSSNLSDNKSLVCKYVNSINTNLIDKESYKYIDNIILLNGYSTINDLLEYNSKIPFSVIYNLFNEITELPKNIFKNCQTLTNVSQIPDNYTKLGDDAFNGCLKLYNINIPNSITEIGDSVFDGCRLLKSIDVSNVTKIGRRAFAGTGISSINLNSSISYLAPFIFTDCVNLKEFIFEGNLNISEGAFAGCTSLTKVIINDYTGYITNDTDEIIYNDNQNIDNPDEPGGNEPGGDDPEPQPEPKKYFLYDLNLNLIKLYKTDDFDNGTGEISQDEAQELKERGLVNYDDSDENVTNIIVKLTKQLYINVYSDDKILYSGIYGNEIIKYPDNYFNSLSEFYESFSIDFDNIQFNDDEEQDVIYGELHIKTGIIPVYDSSKTYIGYFIKDYIENGEDTDFNIRQSQESEYQLKYDDEYNIYFDENFQNFEDQDGYGTNYPLYMKGFSKIGKQFDNDYIIYLNSHLAEQYNTNYASVKSFKGDIYYYYDSNELNYGLNNSSMIFGSGDDDILQNIQTSGTNILPNYIFAGCKNLNVSNPENVSFINQITNIGVGSLMNCLALTNYNHNLNYINKYGFKDCLNLQYIDLSQCKYIGSYAFKNCQSLTNIDISSLKSLSYKSVFEDCINLEVISGLRSSIQKIGDNYFKNCKSLTSFNFSNITEIGNQSFFGCKLLGLGNSTNEEEVVLNLSSVTKLGDYAFANCSSITNVILNESLNNESLGQGVFMNCSSLKEIELPSSITNFTPKLFNNCSSLESVTILGNIDNNIELSGLSNCYKIKSIEILNSDKYITIDNKAIIEKDTNTIIYVVKDLTVLEITSDYIITEGEPIKIDNNAFNNSNISILNINEEIESPDINEKTFANISNNNFHILISRNDVNYKKYMNILGNNKIYYI